MWPWSGNASGLGGSRRYERRIELPLGGELAQKPWPPEGVIVEGDIIKDDYFYSYAVSGSALIFPASVANKWIGVTTNRGTVVVLGSAVLKTKYSPGTYKPNTRDHRLGVGYMLSDGSVTMCDPMISRVHVMDYLTRTPDANGMYTVLVQVNGAPVPGMHLFLANCGTKYVNSQPVHYYFLSGNSAKETLIEPVNFYGRELVDPDRYGVFYLDVHNIGTSPVWHDAENWTHLRGRIISLPLISNQCIAQTSSGGGWTPTDCTSIIPSSECTTICSDPGWSCHYIYYNGQWNLAENLCVSPCACDYNQQELSRIWCELSGRFPVVGDELFLKCCQSRT
jgi:hypothetical protein